MKKSRLCDNPVYRKIWIIQSILYRKDSIKSLGDYFLEMIFRLGAYSRGLNRGEGLFKSTSPEVYLIGDDRERLSNILKKKAAKKDNKL